MGGKINHRIGQRKKRGENEYAAVIGREPYVLFNEACCGDNVGNGKCEQMLEVFGREHGSETDSREGLDSPLP